MWPFSQTATVELEPAPQTAEERYREIDAAYQVAEKEFNQKYRELFAYGQKHPDPRTTILNSTLYCRLNAMRAVPERQRLESVVSKALEVRNRLMAQRAELKLKLGL
jgi:hypothetical protein